MQLNFYYYDWKNKKINVKFDIPLFAYAWDKYRTVIENLASIYWFKFKKNKRNEEFSEQFQQAIKIGLEAQKREYDNMALKAFEPLILSLYTHNKKWLPTGTGSINLEMRRLLKAFYKHDYSEVAIEQKD
jgi:hypothetical protein